MQKATLQIIEGDDMEFEISDNKKDRNADDDFFDQVVGALQETVISHQFEEMHQQFLQKNCLIFDETEENKVEYMPIFKSYQDLIEKYIENSIAKLVPHASMERFNDLLSARTEQIDEQLLDMLLSFSDFSQFKKLMLEYKVHFQQEQAKANSKATGKQKPQEKPVKKNKPDENANFGIDLCLTVKPLRKK